ncbi:inner centromere protein isoform X3 [Xiphophorus couchianus]|uniref:inner centromere protein isoform X3 n=1 Tax=Xiphophorus couchianus TaxID=32473 RepID=UPI001016E118|nr:inner centromere protein isoform X3 [Xiphophorus couchianus]
MNSVLPSVRSLAEMFVGKTQEFINEIENVHMVWLEEIQQEANRMFSRDFNAEPELMPKTPSQKKNSRRRRVSAGRQEESQARRFSKGKRSNLRGSSVKPFNLIPEEEAISEVSTSKASNPPKPKRATRKNKQTKPEDVDESLSFSDSSKQEDVQNKKQELVKEEDEVDKIQKVNAETKSDNASITSQSPPKIRSAELVVNISAEDRLSAELANKPEASPGRTATKIAIAAADRRSRRSSARCSLKLRHSLAGLRHSMTQESIRRASRRSMLKRMSTRMGTSTSSSSNTGGSSALMESADEDNEEVKAETEDIVDDLPEKASEASKPESGREVPVPAVERVTRSVAANSPKLAPPPLFCSVVKMSTPAKKSVAAARKQSQATQRSSLSTKRKAPDTEYSPTKRFSPPKKSQSTMKPSMRAFLHTVNKNQMLMMTPSSIGRTAVIKSFIKQATPLKVDPKTKERHKLEALRKKQEQEEERMRKMEEEKKKKQEEQKRKREDRIKRVFEAKVKEDLREEEKKKKIEQKMAQIDEKNDKVCKRFGGSSFAPRFVNIVFISLSTQRQAEEKAKKKLAAKRQEELEQKKKLEEEARKKKIQQEEEKRQQELAAKKKAEEEEQQTRKALERQREQELERERQAAAERERVEKEKALALQREVERAAREKEKRELEEQRKALEDKRKLEEQQRLAAKEKALKEREEAKRREAAAAEAQKLLNKTVDLEYSVMKTPAGKGGLNVTVDLQEMSVQSYAITPDGGNKMLTISKNPEDYGMDQNSDDSTDDESAPRKPIPSWAEGANLKQLMGKQYFNPIDVDSIFGPIEPLRLENIFYKSKPRFFKRTSSAVWHSPPTGGK